MSLLAPGRTLPFFTAFHGAYSAFVSTSSESFNGGRHSRRAKQAEVLAATVPAHQKARLGDNIRVSARLFRSRYKW
jgi:hypothetical protein